MPTERYAFFLGLIIGAVLSASVREGVLVSLLWGLAITCVLAIALAGVTVRLLPSWGQLRVGWSVSSLLPTLTSPAQKVRVRASAAFAIAAVLLSLLAGGIVAGGIVGHYIARW